MSNIIGVIHQNETHGQTTFKGQITTLALQLKFELEENRYKSSDAAPDYRILCAEPNKEGIPIGAVWKRTTAPKNGKEGGEMMNLTFDDPSFEKPLNVAAFKNDDNSWNITFRRRQDRD